jgi:hypothetical protein
MHEDCFAFTPVHLRTAGVERAARSSADQLSASEYHQVDCMTEGILTQNEEEIGIENPRSITQARAYNRRILTIDYRHELVLRLDIGISSGLVFRIL